MRSETPTSTSTSSEGPAPTLRARVPAPPTGRDRVGWWGPGLLWAMSAVGSGSVLFTPRVGSEYGYAFLWLLLGVAALMWVMIREAGRFAVMTGRTLLDGFSTLPGPRNWALWVVFVPQLAAAVAGVGGLAALVGSALSADLPGSLLIWSLVVLAVSTVVVVSGGYRMVSRAALLLALLLVMIMVVAAGRVFGSPGELASGLLPHVTSQVDVPFLLPWIGTILAGSMGIVWFSYWAATRGYGGGTAQLSQGEGTDDEPGEVLPADQREARLGTWFSTLSTTATIGVVTGTVIITAFLVLGAELLGPQGIVPSGSDVATELTQLLSEVWGETGYWLMVVAIVVALGGSVLANQDGWARSFADITLLLPLRPEQDGGDTQGAMNPLLRRLVAWRPATMGTRRALKVLYAAVVTGLLPAVVVVLVRDPVAIMSVSGIIATVHTPFIVLGTLAVNRRLPHAVAPSRASQFALALAGVFYTLFAGAYLASTVGLLGG